MTKIYILENLTKQQKKDKNTCIYIINTLYNNLKNNPGENTLFNVCTAYEVNIYNAIQTFNEIQHNSFSYKIEIHKYDEKIHHIRAKLDYLKQMKDQLEYVKSTSFIK